jgi:hypothetical protein
LAEIVVVPYGLFDELGVRSTNDKGFLYASKSKTFKSPLQQRRVAYREQALAIEMNIR